MARRHALPLLAGGLLVGVSVAVAQPPAKEPPRPAAGSGFNDAPTAEQLAFFEKKVRPALVEHCYKCHSADADKLRGGLALDTRDGVRSGGDSGPAVVAGSPDRSPLVKAVRHKDPTTQMPPKGKLPESVVADLEAWVRMGAPDPRDGAARRPTGVTAADIETGRRFWAFVPPVRGQVPTPRHQNPTNPVDAFLQVKRDAQGLKTVAPADPRTLLRRVHMDLTGLPPPPAEVEAFAANPSPAAFEAVVDNLLASPRFGERWGRHWLDVARYAETTGKTVNVNYPHAWRYRDYVIAAFNADKPFDQFVREQLAGDLLPTDDPKVRAERLVATGFLAIGSKALNERNGVQFELDVADEQIDVTTQAFLGLTAACARCHDHKFDPIPAADYYALAGIFRSTETCYGTVRFIQANRPSALLTLPADGGAARTPDALSAAERKRIQDQIDTLQKDTSTDPIRRLFTNGQVSLLRAKLDAYDADGTPKLLAMGVRDKPAARGGFGGRRPGAGFGFGGTAAVGDSPVYVRGEPDHPGAVVPRGALQVVSTRQPKITGGSGRKELAEWIASKDNPLTARVFVNRVWLHLFGRGLVPTPDNFGAAGQPPSHPELLDHLAVAFMDDGWSAKKLIRRLVLTDAYRLGSRHDAANVEADPDNVLLWRTAPRRLDAEALRDAVLAVSGQLDPAPRPGSAVARAGDGPTRRPGFGRSGGGVNADDPRDTARSVYLPIVRDGLPEALALFDAADPSLIVAERPATTTPAQSLFLLNSPFVLNASDAAATRLLKDTTTDSERVREAYLRFYGRPPSGKELAAAEAFLTQYRSAAAADRVPPSKTSQRTWAAFCQALFASAEFQFRR